MCLGNGGCGKGLVALQSLSTIKKGTRPFNFQSNEPFLEFLRQQIALSKFLSDAFRENTRYGRGEGIHPAITLNLESALKLLISNPMSPLRSLYDHSFYINLICPQGITWNPRLEGSGGLLSSKT